jgi:hypothetical protein
MSKRKQIETLLPDSLSGVMRVALKDEARAFKSPFYRIDMGGWHDPIWEDSTYLTDDDDDINEPARCDVCLAGAVMAGTLKLDRATEGSPDLWPELNSRLQSLDSIRDGSIASALLEGEYDLSSLPPHPICSGVVDVENAILEKIGEAPIYFIEGHGNVDETDPNIVRKEWRKWMFRCARELEARGL